MSLHNPFHQNRSMARYNFGQHCNQAAYNTSLQKPTAPHHSSLTKNESEYPC